MTTLPAPTMAPSPMTTFARMVAPDPIDAPCLYQSSSRPSSRPPSAARRLAVVARGIGVVDERDAVADEDVVFDGHAFADEGVARDLAAACRRVAFFWISTNAPSLVSSPISHP